jgi:hypothetical protein
MVSPAVCCNLDTCIDLALFALLAGSWPEWPEQNDRGLDKSILALFGFSVEFICTRT